MSGIGVAGNLILDRYMEIEAYPERASLTTIHSVTPSPGGLAYNCAVDLARLDPSLPISVVGLVGDDSDGDAIVSHFHPYPSIDTSRIRRVGQTSFSDVMEDAQTRERTFFQFRGANALLDEEDINFASADIDLLHVGYILLLDRLDAPDPEFGTRMARLLAQTQSRGIKTSVDVVSEVSDRFRSIVPAALRYCDYCIVNEVEASRTTGIEISHQGTVDVEALRRAAQAIVEMGVSTWAVIHWAGGAAGLTPDGEWVVRPSIRLAPNEIVTSTGAGDAFASGVLYGAWKELSLAESIELGSAAAAGSLHHGNSTDGVGPWREMLQAYADAEYEDLS
ncbi:carbohydrate kinase family protein [Actinomycetaceae bacterium WB03_NA08]|uniref:Carbohydrate kinase family protein n=1 Tax=Scrofimicrobium canadense TaxID=2652290 RepID=A0A6N7VS85_9ACTO|nr:carbohydrate kinase family protein [Scrofimicrobium canadense]MSS84647.1 carbohydrate kinase family protein [Scrofimicrobium canadense]